MTTRRLRTPALIATTTLALLSGCAGAASGGPEPSTTAELYEQAMANREQFWKELDDMEKVVGGKWEVADARIAENCLGKLSGQAYTYYGFRQRAVPVEDAQAAADAMQKFWDGLGYTTQQVTYHKDHLLVVAKDLNGWEIGFTTEGLGTDRRTTIDATTGCFRGDFKTVLKYQVAWEKEHPQPTPSPNDEQGPPTE